MLNHQSAAERLKDTFYIVEANDNERNILWERHCPNSHLNKFLSKILDDGEIRKQIGREQVEWKEISDGWMVAVGEVTVDGEGLFERRKLPVCISTSWARINGQLVMFWHQCSRATDCMQAENWIKKHFVNYSGYNCDAAGFHNCLRAIGS